MTWQTSKEREDRILKNMHLVDKHVRRYRKFSAAGFEELQAAGRLGLILAVDSWEAYEGDYPWENYAGNFIREKIYNAYMLHESVMGGTESMKTYGYLLRKIRKLGREPTDEDFEEIAKSVNRYRTAATLKKMWLNIGQQHVRNLDEPIYLNDEDCNVNLSDVLADENAVNPEEVAIENNHRTLFWRAYNTLDMRGKLPCRQKHAFLRHLDPDEPTLQTIADEQGCKNQNVDQLIARVVKKIKNLIALNDFEEGAMGYRLETSNGACI